MEKLEERFYEIVKAMPEKKKEIAMDPENYCVSPNVFRSYIWSVYQRAVDELEDIADKTFYAESINDLAECAEHHMEVRYGFILGLKYFRAIEVQENLDLMLRNTKIMIADKIELVRMVEMQDLFTYPRGDQNE